MNVFLGHGLSLPQNCVGEHERERELTCLAAHETLSVGKHEAGVRVGRTHNAPEGAASDMGVVESDMDVVHSVLSRDESDGVVTCAIDRRRQVIVSINRHPLTKIIDVFLFEKIWEISGF